MLFKHAHFKYLDSNGCTLLKASANIICIFHIFHSLRVYFHLFLLLAWVVPFLGLNLIPIFLEFCLDFVLLSFIQFLLLPFAAVESMNLELSHLLIKGHQLSAWVKTSDSAVGSSAHSSALHQFLRNPVTWEPWQLAWLPRSWKNLVGRKEKGV